MNFVPWNKENGQIQWERIEHSESAQEFAKSKNARLAEVGINQQCFFVVSPTQVEEIGLKGKIVANWFA